MWRLVLWLARVGVAWVPALALAAWGTVYLRYCFDTVVSPGVPVTYAYESSDGLVTVSASRYIVDVVNQRVELQGLTLTRPDGQVVARAAHAMVSSSPGGFRVKVKSVEASLDRAKDGQVNFKGLLPKPTGEPDKTRVEVEVDTATVVYRDLTQATPLVQRAVIKGLTVARADGDTLVSADVQGAAQVAAWAKANGDWSADVRLAGGDLSWLVAPARLWAPDQGGDWSADRVSGQGRLLVDYRGGRVAASGDVRLTADGLTVGKTLQKADIVAELHGGLGQVQVKGSSLEPGRAATFEGVVAYGDKLSAAGKFRATVRSRADVWPLLASTLPKDLQFKNAVYAGSVSVRDDKPTVVGDITADRVSSGGVDLDKVAGTLGVSGNRVAIAAKNLEFQGTAWSGQIDLDTRSGAVKGFAEASDDFAKLFPHDKVAVTVPGQAKVLVGGTMEHLTATLDGTAKVGWMPEGKPSVELGDLVARATLKDGKVALDHCILRGKIGTAKLSGMVDIQDRTLDLRANLPGIRLDPFFDSIQGTIATDFAITGTFDAWVYEGRAEAYGIETPEFTVPQVVVEYTGDKDNVSVSELRARLLGGRLTATGYVDLAEGTVAADFNAQDLDVARLTRGEVVGQFDLADGHVGGSLDSLVADTKATSNGLVAGGVRIDDVSALLSLEGQEVNLSEAKATVGGGQVSADGMFAFDTLAMSLAGSWAGVKLASIVPSALDLATEGTTSGEFLWGDPGLGVPTGKATVRLDGLSLAHLELGSGTIDADLSSSHVRASGTIGSIDRFIQLVDLDYSVESEEISASIDVAEFGLQQAVVAALAQAEEVSSDTRNLVQTLGGSLSAHVDVSGDAKNPVVKVPKLTVNHISAEGRSMGDLLASGSYSQGTWSIEHALWTKDDARIDVSGSVGADNELAAKLEVVGLEMADVGAFLPVIDIDHGLASGTILFSGKADSPTARGSLKLEGVVLQDGTGKPVPIPLTVNASEVVWRDGLLTTDGDFTVATTQVQGGLTGGFTLKLPTKGWGVDDARPVDVEARMDDRPLAALAGVWPEIEEAGTSGSVSANLQVYAKKGDILIGGKARVVADDKGESTLKIKSIAQPLRDVAALIEFGGRSARLSASATSPFGGKATVEARVDSEEAFHQAFSPENLLAGTVIEGKLLLDKLAWRGRTAGTDRDSSLRLDGEIGVNGPLDEPKVGGRLELQGAALYLAPGVPPGTTPEKPVIDPSFQNLTIVADHGTQINVATATVNLFGTGTLTGSLSDPTFSAELGLDGGTLRLPTNRITLEDEGRIRVLAEGFPPTVRVDVDLTGRTIVTARQTSDQYQTYTVNLDIKGNLLGEEPLQIKGTSDPPDLTNEQIMAILGERQLIESLADSALGKGSSQGLRDSFYSVAVPTLTAGLTDNLAQGLGLDYLLFDYNPLDQALLRVGKSLGKGLMLQGVRQLSQPTFGRTKYEIALSYRPPFRDRFFSRVRFTLGQDQDVPWKLGVGWSIRF